MVLSFQRYEAEYPLSPRHNRVASVKRIIFLGDFYVDSAAVHFFNLFLLYGGVQQLANYLSMNRLGTRKFVLSVRTENS